MPGQYQDRNRLGGGGLNRFRDTNRAGNNQRNFGGGNFSGSNFGNSGGRRFGGDRGGNRLGDANKRSYMNPWESGMAPAGGQGLLPTPTHPPGAGLLGSAPELIGPLTQLSHLGTPQSKLAIDIISAVLHSNSQAPTNLNRNFMTHKSRFDRAGGFGDRRGGGSLSARPFGGQKFNRHDQSRSSSSKRPYPQEDARKVLRAKRSKTSHKSGDSDKDAESTESADKLGSEAEKKASSHSVDEVSTPQSENKEKEDGEEENDEKKDDTSEGTDKKDQPKKVEHRLAYISHLDSKYHEEMSRAFHAKTASILQLLRADSKLSALREMARARKDGITGKILQCFKCQCRVFGTLQKHMQSVEHQRAYENEQKRNTEKKSDEEIGDHDEEQEEIVEISEQQQKSVEFSNLDEMEFYDSSIKYGESFIDEKMMHYCKLCLDVMEHEPSLRDAHCRSHAHYRQIVVLLEREKDEQIREEERKKRHEERDAREKEEIENKKEEKTSDDENVEERKVVEDEALAESQVSHEHAEDELPELQTNIEFDEGDEGGQMEEEMVDPLEHELQEEDEDAEQEEHIVDATEQEEHIDDIAEQEEHIDDAAYEVEEMKESLSQADEQDHEESEIKPEEMENQSDHEEDSQRVHRSPRTSGRRGRGRAKSSTAATPLRRSSRN